ncbi:MAG: hypothetical protein CVU89_10895 [Firmicutes bacterium HGW-Firmicutes-14]|jgi:hypothetical protein|nr:MAG: hypothetical protein CVU89_10895 [Firmicutes bacterium HGW-Firmicutes-14]
MTKNQLTAKIKEQSSLLSAAVLGLGVGLIITIIFSKIGVLLVLAGLVVKIFEPAISLSVLKLYKFKPVTCPFCRETSQVRINAIDFSCDNCGRSLTTEKGKVKLFRHLKLAVNNCPNIYGKPVLNGPMDSGQKLT